LYDGEGREIDHLKFDVTEWRAEATEKRFTMGSCSLKIKVKRKLAL
jgi:hypothetical protein